MGFVPPIRGSMGGGVLLTPQMFEFDTFLGSEWSAGEYRPLMHGPNQSADIIDNVLNSGLEPESSFHLRIRPTNVEFLRALGSQSW